VPRAVRERIIARAVYTGPVRAPVEEGHKVGVLKVWRGDIVALEVPLQAAESVASGSMARRAFDAASELVLGLFRAGLQRAIAGKS
jgi:D-alanyl-D-alanine carboxypeptidase (penicillin-binding protein 5/6)